ncbi:MAG: universal stress protein [Campylobacterales bacterium]|nr:universal stress protein [Campylobacterales bacterium]
MSILVAIDFSQSSFTVLAKALSLADTKEAELHIIHVIETPWYTLKEDMKSVRNHLWDTLSSAFPTLHKKNFHCLQGNVTREISETAESIHATLLVIGSSGENYIFKEFLTGSTTKSIIRDAAIPVLIVKNEIPLDPKRILIPTNFSDYSRTLIHQTSVLFPDAEIILLYAYILPFERRLKSYGFNEDDISDYHAMIKAKEDEKADVFVASLQIPEERLQIMMRKEPLSPDFFLDISTLYQSDLIAVHTSGSFSFFAFDLLEESPLDVLIFSF